MKQKLFVVQKLVLNHAKKNNEKLDIWRTVSHPMSQHMAEQVQRKLRQSWSKLTSRLLNSPSKREMTLGVQIEEWSL